ncbi:MAG: metallophosphoesterase [Betaproteobacteria bacterium]
MTDSLTVTLPDDCTTIALAGGPYSNFGAVGAFLHETSDIEARFCLGDIGGFGPLPDRTLDLIRDSGLVCLQGNYDHAIGHGENDCGCGYIDPLDRHYAQVSFDYTESRTSARHKEWLRALPQQILIRWRGHRLLLCHGSPVQVNEFVWESETPDATIAGWLDLHRVTGICATHSGLPWIREVPGRGFWFNTGVLGRPAHEDSPRVFYGRIDLPPDSNAPQPRLVELNYDPAPVAAAMRAEGLPEVFAESLLGGRWTTCCNILPATERVPRDRLASIELN